MPTLVRQCFGLGPLQRLYDLNSRHRLLIWLARFAPCANYLAKTLITTITLRTVIGLPLTVAGWKVDRCNDATAASAMNKTSRITSISVIVPSLLNVARSCTSPCTLLA